MPRFKLKEDLPKSVQNRIDDLLAKPTHLRDQVEADFLLALTPYLENVLILEDHDGLIVIGAGNTIPTGDEGFTKGALFIKLNASGNGLYINTGDEDSASWDLADSISADNFENNVDLSDKNVAVAEILEATVVDSVKASGSITIDAETDVTDGDPITVGNVEYTFVDALSTEPTVENEVLIGATTDDTLANLVLAINGGTGEGTNYSTGTVENPDVSAGEVSSHATALTAKVYGVAGNSLDLITSAAELTLSDDTLTGGLAGTSALPGTIKSDATNLYICTSYSATDGYTWKQVALSALGA